EALPNIYSLVIPAIFRHQAEYLRKLDENSNYSRYPKEQPISKLGQTDTLRDPAAGLGVTMTWQLRFVEN
ncbi:MAG: hypothetical protein KAI90_03520, partial [Desulfobulbaceae bacterium]|nr:hypothetical protein [Desulfobulbaceae bacterium]